MSKKNNRSIIARRHAHDLKLEKEAQEKQKKKQEKADRKKARQLAATGEVRKKRKGLRLRKGVRVKGVKIVDSESKKKVLELLQQEQADKLMEVEEAADKAQDKKRTKKRSKIKVVTKKSSSSKSKAAAQAAAAGPTAMEA